MRTGSRQSGKHESSSTRRGAESLLRQTHAGQFRLLSVRLQRSYPDSHFAQADQMEVVQAARAEQANIASQLDENRNGPPESVKVSNLPLEASRSAKIPELVKTARAHAKKYTQGPPLVPAILVDSIQGYIQKARLKKMRECIEKICRYWSLKREARRGAPLLKRLYLEVRITSIPVDKILTEISPHASPGRRRALPESRPMRRRLRSLK
jgi:hypothetical protein